MKMNPDYLAQLEITNDLLFAMGLPPDTTPVLIVYDHTHDRFCLVLQSEDFTARRLEGDPVPEVEITRSDADDPYPNWRYKQVQR